MFHVPEHARVRQHPFLASTTEDGNNGAFVLDSPEPGWKLALIASDGEGWEHVSVHVYQGDGRKQRIPTWKEMCYVKRMFWNGEDEVVQFHPKESEYVNCHPQTLHLWRPIGFMFPTPPSELVGPR